MIKAKRLIELLQRLPEDAELSGFQNESTEGIRVRTSEVKTFIIAEHTKVSQDFQPEFDIFFPPEPKKDWSETTRHILSNRWINKHFGEKVSIHSIECVKNIYDNGFSYAFGGRYIDGTPYTLVTSSLEEFLVMHHLATSIS